MFSTPVRGACLLALVTSGLLVLGSCTDEGLSDPPTAGTPVRLLLRPTLAAVSTEASDAPPVNRIRVTVVDSGTDATLVTTEEDVDPNAESWSLEVQIDVTGSTAAVRVLVELLNVVGGVETHAWSGEAGPVELTPGEDASMEVVELVRGPPDNLAVTGVTIVADSGRVREGGTLALDAEVETEEEQQVPTVFWTSLAPDVGSVDDRGVVSGLLPGTAPVVAEAGPHADTLEVTVLARPVRVLVHPDTARSRDLADTVSFTATFEDDRGDPVGQAEVEWSVGDPALAESLGDGTFLTLATGETRVHATLLSDPAIADSATLIVDTGPRVLEIVEGDGQEAVVNTAVPVPPAARVLDASGRPLSRVEVLFEVVSGGGSLSGATAVTDAEGIARPEQWVLGTTTGANEVAASIPAVPDVTGVSFGAAAMAGPVSALEIVEGDGQEVRGGEPVPIPPAVRALDEFGNAVPDGLVTFLPGDYGGLNGDGASVGGSPAETDANGIARPTSWTLGVRTGTYALTASGGESVSVGFSATALPTLTPAVEVGVGRSFSCALNVAGEAFCWGSDVNETLGTDAILNTQATSAPVQVQQGGLLFQDLEVRGYMACGVTDTAEVHCWGYDLITDPAGVLVPQPAPFTAGFQWTDFSVGLRHACGVELDVTTYCWGDNRNLQIGNPNVGTHVASPTPVSGAVRFESVRAGFFASCALASDGTAYCWGTNGPGVLGDPQVLEAATPNPVATSVVFEELDGGVAFFCARTAAGEGYCWGSNASAQLGINVDPLLTGSVDTPQRIAGGHLHFDFGLPPENSVLLHACSLDQEGGGVVLCWGFNDSGQIGSVSADVCNFNGTLFDCAWDPQVAGNGLEALVVDAGYNHTCAVTFVNDVVCWGANESGQLGNGTTVNSTDPVLVLHPPLDPTDAVIIGAPRPAPRVSAPGREVVGGG